ncbi:MAG: hypothetical protein ACJ8FO_01700 [Sphingomicrobium sp.]
MKFRIAAAFALAVPSSLAAQAIGDLTTATPIAGEWSYAPTADGSEARFANASAVPQLWLHCTRATRRVTIAKAAGAAAPLLNVWTSALAESVASTFIPATGRLTADLAGADPLLDGIANGRGRIGFGVAGQPPLVVPAWAEAARVIEDCRG